LCFLASQQKACETAKVGTISILIERELSKVIVRRKGQVTLPIALRRELGPEEGDILQVEKTEKGILLKKLLPSEAGGPVGDREHERLIAHLEDLREAWR
jgi:AbrB family looped-hinge helix DNA binding protein